MHVFTPHIYTSVKKGAEVGSQEQRIQDDIRAIKWKDSEDDKAGVCGLESFGTTAIWLQ